LILFEAMVFPTCTSDKFSSVMNFLGVALKSTIIWKDQFFKEEAIVFALWMIFSSFSIFMIG